jgi:hypothetical protein
MNDKLILFNRTNIIIFITTLLILCMVKNSKSQSNFSNPKINMNTCAPKLNGSQPYSSSDCFSDKPFIGKNCCFVTFVANNVNYTMCTSINNGIIPSSEPSLVYFGTSLTVDCCQEFIWRKIKSYYYIYIIFVIFIYSQ